MLHGMSSKKLAQAHKKIGRNEDFFFQKKLVRIQSLLNSSFLRVLGFKIFRLN